jgi:hypothetical protein
VTEAVFEHCPGLIDGRIAPEEVATLASRGFRRQRSMEETLRRARPEAGNPIVVAAGSTESPVILAYWPDRQFCNVSFKGGEAEAAFEAVLARLEADSSGFARQASGDDPQAGALLFRSGAGASARVVRIHRPDPEDESRSFAILVESGR